MTKLTAAFLAAFLCVACGDAYEVNPPLIQTTTLTAGPTVEPSDDRSEGSEVRLRSLHRMRVWKQTQERQRIAEERRARFALIASAISDYPFWHCVRRWEGVTVDHVGRTQDGLFRGPFGISEDAWQDNAPAWIVERWPHANLASWEINVIGAREVYTKIGDRLWYGHRRCRTGQG